MHGATHEWTKRVAVAIAFSALAVLLAACGSSSDHEPVGQTSSALTSICGAPPVVSTFDGYPAYKYCGNFNVYSNDGKNTRSTPASGWVQTEGGYGYQCVEFAVRYFYFRWGVPHTWFVPGAKDMCGTHPSGVSQTSNPIKGDLMVFGPGSCGADPTFGHVGVVNAVNGSTIQLAQQNTAGIFNYNKSCASCFLHAAANNGGAVSDPCAGAPASGYYCGQSTQWPGGQKDWLYLCQNGATSSKVYCPGGCIAEPFGTNDKCNGAPDPCSGAADGATCGASLSGGDASTLYDCAGGVTQSTTACQYGCSGGACNPAPGSGGTGGSAGAAGAGGSAGASGSGGSAGATGSGGSGGSGWVATDAGTGASGAGATEHTTVISGQSGSCSVGPGPGDAPLSALAALFGAAAALAFGRRRRRRERA